MAVVVFSAGDVGEWAIRAVTTCKGLALSPAAALSVRLQDADGAETPPVWRLTGFASNLRYATGREVGALRQVQAELGRGSSTRAALIPIRKSDAWWAMAQDERRAIFEEQSHHTRIGMEYLPAVARRLLHCRDLGEPFDFLTWFEYAPEDEAAFDDLLVRLRRAPEWTFVEREIDIRLERAGASD